jgi:putative transposase
MILLAFDGFDNQDIADRIGCERHAVGIWRRRWTKEFRRLVLVECCEKESALRAAAEELLSDLPRPGCPCTFSAEEVTQILAVACEPPSRSGRPVTHWTPRELTDEVIKRRIVESISPRHVGRFLKYGRPAAATGSMRSRKTRSSSRRRSWRSATATTKPLACMRRKALIP